MYAYNIYIFFLDEPTIKKSADPRGQLRHAASKSVREQRGMLFSLPVSEHKGEPDTVERCATQWYGAEFERGHERG